MEIFRPTHPLNLKNSRFFFLKPSLNREGLKKIGIFQTLVGGWVWKMSFSKTKHGLKMPKLPKYSFKQTYFFPYLARSCQLYCAL